MNTTQQLIWIVNIANLLGHKKWELTNLDKGLMKLTIQSNEKQNRKFSLKNKETAHSGGRKGKTDHSDSKGNLAMRPPYKHKTITTEHLANQVGKGNFHLED